VDTSEQIGRRFSCHWPEQFISVLISALGVIIVITLSQMALLNELLFIDTISQYSLDFDSASILERHTELFSAAFTYT
jgi:hypothetical protein